MVLNISVLSASATGGLLSITDGDGSQATLHMRFLGNRTTPQPMQTERMVKVGPDGRLTFSQSSAAGVHLVIDLMGYFLRTGIGPEAGVFAGRYAPMSPRPILTRVGTGSGPQLRLYQHQPLPLFPGVGDFGNLGYNIVVSPDQPGLPTLLGLYDADSPWTPTVTLSSTPARQPTELTVRAGFAHGPALVNLSSATWTYAHAYLTGYYWYNHCVACLNPGG